MSKCISQTERESKVVDIHVKHAIIACHVPKAVAHDSLERPMAQVLQSGGEVYADIITADAVEYRRVSIVIRMVVPSARHLLLPPFVQMIRDPKLKRRDTYIGISKARYVLRQYNVLTVLGSELMTVIAHELLLITKSAPVPIAI